MHIVVPNGLSLHRLVGVEMGLQPDPLAITEGDTAQGHVRNYTLDTLLADVARRPATRRHVQPRVPEGARRIARCSIGTGT